VVYESGVERVAITPSSVAVAVGGNGGREGEGTVVEN